MASVANIVRKSITLLAALATRMAITGVAGFLTSIPAAASIFNGKIISISETPWQLLFEYAQDKKGCAATWLGGRWALTAGHCLTNADLPTSAVYAGISTRGEAVPASRIPIKRFIPHPDFSGLRHDLALLELAADVTATLAKPIAYAMRADSAAGLTDPGKLCRISGFGIMDGAGTVSEELRMTDTKIVDHYGNPLLLRQIRVGGPGVTPGISACKGDSGGPMVARDASGTGWILIGVTSTGTDPCGAPAVYSNYTRVSGYADWIQSVVGGAADLNPPLPFQEKNLLSVRAGRMRLSRPQQLEILFTDLRGSASAQSSGYFTAGDHAILPSGLPPGAYTLRIRAGRTEAFRGVQILP